MQSLSFAADKFVFILALVMNITFAQIISEIMSSLWCWFYISCNWKYNHSSLNWDLLIININHIDSKMLQDRVEWFRQSYYLQTRRKSLNDLDSNVCAFRSKYLHLGNPRTASKIISTSCSPFWDQKQSALVHKCRFAIHITFPVPYQHRSCRRSRFVIHTGLRSGTRYHDASNMTTCLITWGSGVSSLKNANYLWHKKAVWCMGKVRGESMQTILSIPLIYFTHALNDMWGEDLRTVVSYSS